MAFHLKTKGPGQVLLFLCFLRVVSERLPSITQTLGDFTKLWSKQGPQTHLSGEKAVCTFCGTSLRSDFPKRQPRDEKQIDSPQFL